MTAPHGTGAYRGFYKKLINDPFDAVDEALDGFAAAHADLIRLAEPRVIARRVAAQPKVGLVIGGGSGHEPAFAGYVGQGIADAAACGNVFASPPPDVILGEVLPRMGDKPQCCRPSGVERTLYLDGSRIQPGTRSECR